MVEKITLIDEKGEVFQSDEVAVFNTKGGKYLITTNNSLDPNGLVVLNASEVEGDRLNTIQDGENWDAVTDTMRSIIAGGEDVEFDAMIEKANVNRANYFRAISVNGDAVKVMKEVYQNKRPVASPVVEEAAVKEVVADENNMFSATGTDIYPKDGTPVVSDMSQVQLGNQIANGINEVAAPIPTPTGFEQVNNLENPVDLMENNTEIPVATPDDIVKEEAQNKEPTEAVAPVVEVVVEQTGEQPNVAPANITNEIVGNLGNVDPEIVGSLQQLNASIINIVETLKQKELEKINQERAKFEVEKSNFELQKSGFEAQVMNGINQANANTQSIGVQTQPAQIEQTPVPVSVVPPVAPIQVAEAVEPAPAPIIPFPTGEMVQNNDFNPNSMNESMMGPAPVVEQTDPSLQLKNAA